MANSLGAYPSVAIWRNSVHSHMAATPLRSMSGSGTGTDRTQTVRDEHSQQQGPSCLSYAIFCLYESSCKFSRTFWRLIGARRPIKSPQDPGYHISVPSNGVYLTFLSLVLQILGGFRSGTNESRWIDLSPWSPGGNALANNGQ